MAMSLGDKMEAFKRRWAIFHGDHPPYPETLEMNRFKRAWKAFFADEKEDWKFIGYIQFDVTETKRETKETTTHTCFCNLYMTPDGKRMYEIFATNEGIRDWLEENGDGIAACKAWVSGGKFPDKMVPENDVLASMLARLTAEKLTGDK